MTSSLDIGNDAECLPPFYHPIDRMAPRIWPGYKLIMPICAVGNVGQLTCDLLISTLLHKKECQLVGRIYSPAMMPVVGPNAFNPYGPPTTSTELYICEKFKLLIIQQRTSYFKQLKTLFVKDLVDWIKESKFDQVIALTSSFAQCNPDLSVLDTPNVSHIYSIVTDHFDSCSDGWTDLELKKIQPERTIEVVQDGLTFLPGSGMTKLMFKAFQKSSIPAAFLVTFCSDGITIPESHQAANIVGRYVGLLGDQIERVSDKCKVDTWMEPISWRDIADVCN